MAVIEGLTGPEPESSSTSSQIPLAHPSTVRNRTTGRPLIDLGADGTHHDDNGEGKTPEDEGYLDGEEVSDEDGDSGEADVYDDDGGDFEDEAGSSGSRLGRVTVDQGGEHEEGEGEWFDIAIVTMPFVFLYILLDILVHLQYQHRPSLNHLFMDLVKAIPTLGAIVYYTTRYASHALTNPLLMSASVISGCRLIWLVNKAGWAMTTDQAPSMGTLWILTIVQLPLSRAITALGIVAGWTISAGLKVSP